MFHMRITGAAVDVQQLQQPAAQLQPHGVQRQEAQAQAGHDRLLDGLVARHLHRDALVEAVFGEELLHRRARARAVLARDHRVGRQFAHRVRPALQQRVPRWRDEHQRVRGEGFRAGVDLLGRTAHHRQVDLAGTHQLDQLAAFADHAQAHVHARVLLVEARQQLGHEVLGGADQADGQQPVLQPLQPRHGVVGILQRRQQPARMHQEVLAGGRQRQLAALAVEQRQPDLRLQLLDLHRHGRRRQMQRLGGARHAAVLGDLGKDPKLAEADVHH